MSFYLRMKLKHKLSNYKSSFSYYLKILPMQRLMLKIKNNTFKTNNFNKKRLNKN